MTFSRRFPHPGIEPRSPALQADSLRSEPPGKLKPELIIVMGSLLVCVLSVNGSVCIWLRHALHMP